MQIVEIHGIADMNFFEIESGILESRRQHDPGPVSVLIEQCQVVMQVLFSH